MSYRASRDGLPHGPGQHFASCFVVEVEGFWILVTAGHVIKSIGEAMANGVSVHDFNLHDKLAGHKYPFSVPYRFDLDDWAVIESDGADYAASPLSEMFVRNLIAGGIRPISEVSWGTQPLDQYAVWLLAGIPTESLATASARTVLKLTLMPLKETTAPPAANEAPGTKVYAKLISQPGLDAVTIHDIEGMSGGPVFGLRVVGDKVHYWLVGVQSTWYPASRIACFCPLPRFLAAIKKGIQQASRP